MGKSPTKDSHPNYSIFLGSGASVTSGIKTGGNLVDQWRREICEKEYGNYFEGIDENDPDKEEVAKQNAIDYLIKKHGVWYNPQNEYSSLFERKFDLPIQRRRFVEELVDGHLPSIGYLFLISLVNKKYFNTIFTTNFDDLINEAFYQFSNTRPLLCAHDSAVSSISVVSKRPKIIKLHGDYLFDDIKNTIKETESLEQNIKQKFIEFTKDNGLILVGYSGQDRSILDVINYLLQQEDYLKNGLYWCFRAEDEISHEVRKILWKDKVYCVQIDGFDELFTEFCHVANIKPNLIENSADSKRESCINKFVEDYNRAEPKNKWISEFIEEISTAKNNQNISELIRQLNESDTNNLSSDNLKCLLEIESELRKNNHSGALEMVDQKIKDENEEDILENLYKIKVRIYREKNEKDKAFKLIENLIEKDEFNIKYYWWKLTFIEDINEKISFLSKINEKITHNRSVKNFLVKLIIENHIEYGCKSIDLDFCEKLIDESLLLDSSIDNDAYSLKFDFLKVKKNNLIKNIKNPKNQVDEVDEKINKLVEKLQDINPYHSDYIKIKQKYITYKKDLNLTNNFIKEIYEMKSRVSKSKIKEIINTIADIYNEISTYSRDEIESINNFNLYDSKVIDSYFMSYAEDELMYRNIAFMLELSKYIICKKNDFDLLTLVLEKILAIPDSLNFLPKIVHNFSIPANEEINEKLYKFIIDNKSKLSSSDYMECMHLIERSKGKYDLSLDYLVKLNKINTSDDYINLIYLYLLSKNYEKLLEFISSKSSEFKHFSIGDRVIIKINEITARKLKDTNLSSSDKSDLENIIAKHSDNKKILICANSLLEKNGEALHHIKSLISSNYLFYYQMIEWPAINSPLRESAINYFKSQCIDSAKVA